MPEISVSSYYEKTFLSFDLQRGQNGEKQLKFKIPISTFQHMNSGWKTEEFPENANLGNECYLNETLFNLVLINLKSFVLFGTLSDKYLESQGLDVEYSNRGFAMNHLGNISIQKSSNACGSFLWFGFSDPENITYPSKDGNVLVFNKDKYNSFIMNNRLHLNQTQVAYLIDVMLAVWNEKELPKFKDVKQEYKSEFFTSISPSVDSLYSITSQIDDMYERISNNDETITKDYLTDILDDLLLFVFKQGETRHLINLSPVLDVNGEPLATSNVFTWDIMRLLAYIKERETKSSYSHWLSVYDKALDSNYFNDDDDYIQKNFMKKITLLEKNSELAI